VWRGPSKADQSLFVYCPKVAASSWKQTAGRLVIVGKVASRVVDPHSFHPDPDPDPAF
jgi:hypothetical protein